MKIELKNLTKNKKNIKKNKKKEYGGAGTKWNESWSIDNQIE
jgi:hypothetical protein